MSSFFTVPASQRKRKRTQTTTSPAIKKRNTATSKTLVVSKTPGQHARDESISGSESESDGGARKDSEIEEEENTDSEYEDETAAEKRLRLAERYLENLKGEVDETGFDAAEIDKDLIAERLKEDVAETKGRLYRRIASNLFFCSTSPIYFRADTHPTTSIATCPPFAYTVSKDMTLIKWRILDLSPSAGRGSKGVQRGTKGKAGGLPISHRRPKQVAFVKGNKLKVQDAGYQGHVDHILTVAASQDGRFVATGGKDRRLIVWDAAGLIPLRVFTQHRDAVTGLAFRRGTNQLYSSSRDRTIKIWSLDELAYVETLFGHQDEVVDIAALAQERCVSVGARDRTARLWKVVEETQLVFRGGGEKKGKTSKGYTEGSIDRVAMIDDEMFVTGSDNGSLSLWVIHKKKPIFTVPLAHGLNPPIDPSEASAEQNPDSRPLSPPQPRWITALATIPYSDIILSGSWDGNIRAWKVSDDKKKIESLGPIGQSPQALELSLVNSDSVLNGGTLEAVTTNGDQSSVRRDEESSGPVKGVVTDISVFERGERGEDGICVVAALATEHRFGRWIKIKGKNGAVVLEVPTIARSCDTETSGGEGANGKA